MPQIRRLHAPTARAVAVAATTALAALATAAAPRALAAQLAPVSFGVSGGLAIPRGDGADAVDNGYMVGAHLRIAPPLLPVGFRADVNYSRNDAKVGDGHTTILSGFANATLRLAPAVAVIRPYLVGGIGAGRVSGETDLGTAIAAETAFGWQAGGGLELPLVAITAFAEATYQRFSRDGGSLAVVPVRVGLRF